MNTNSLTKSLIINSSIILKIFHLILIVTVASCGNSMIILFEKNRFIPGPSMNARFTSLSTGNMQNCIIRSDNSEVMCWGRDSSGQVSDVPSGGAFSAIGVGMHHTCGIRSDTNEVMCWGSDSSGKVSGAPGGVAFKEISAGLNHTCGIRSFDNTTTCWGALVWNPR